MIPDPHHTTLGCSRNIRQLLNKASHVIQRSPNRLASLDDLTSFASAEGITTSQEIKSAC
jgi:hypothetical protein